MSEQPPVQPPNQPPHQPITQASNQPANQPMAGNPPTQPTQPMPAAAGTPPLGPPAPPVGPAYSSVGPTAPASPYPPKPNMWNRATSSSGRRWGLGLGAGALALLLVLGIGAAGIAILRNHDRVNLLGGRQDRHSLGQRGPGNGNGLGNGLGNGRGPGTGNGNGRNLPGGRIQGLGGLGSLVGGTALHGEVTANAGGSAQALAFQRGEVTAVSDTSITLKSSDGFVGTYGRTSATISRGAALVKGGQAFVLARASDKVAIRTMAMPGNAGVSPSS